MTSQTWSIMFTCKQIITYRYITHVELPGRVSTKEYWSFRNLILEHCKRISNPEKHMFFMNRLIAEVSKINKLFATYVPK